MEAAIGMAQLEEIDKNLDRRAEIAKFYDKNLENLREYLQLPYIPEDRNHRFMMYPIVLKNEPKKALVNFLEEKSIETRDMLPLVNQPIYKKIFGDMEANFPVAKWINQNGFYVPCHPYLSDDDAKYIVDMIHEFFRERSLQSSVV
jgi:dTDP-4-amino-4,6-dideoxygalactose transaminase